MPGAIKKVEKFKFEIGDIIKGTYTTSALIRITAIGEINFLAIEIGDKSERMFSKSGIFRKALPIEIEREKRKAVAPSYNQPRGDKVRWI